MSSVSRASRPAASPNGSARRIASRCPTRSASSTASGSSHSRVFSGRPSSCHVAACSSSAAARSGGSGCRSSAGAATRPLHSIRARTGSRAPASSVQRSTTTPLWQRSLTAPGGDGRGAAPARTGRDAAGLRCARGDRPDVARHRLPQRARRGRHRARRRLHTLHLRSTLLPSLDLPPVMTLPLARFGEGVELYRRGDALKVVFTP